MKLIPKYQTAWGKLNYSIPSDNTRVSPILIPDTRILGKVPGIQAQFIQDNRTDLQKEDDKNRSNKLSEEYLKAKDTEKALRDLSGFLTVTDAATIGTGIGSLVNKGLKLGASKLLKAPKIFLNIVDNPEELGNLKVVDFITLRKAVGQGLKDARDFVLSDAVLLSREFNLKIADRLHMLRLPAYEYELKPVIYHNKFKNKNSNFKGLSPDYIGGYYDRINKTVNLKSNYHNATNARPNAFHENLHAQGYGPSKVNEWKIQFLIDPKRIGKTSPEAKAYYFSPEEFPVHAATLGEKWGVKPGLPYPGDEAFDQLIIDKGIGGSPCFMKRDTPKDKRRFWRTLNGTMFSSSLLNILNNE